VPVDDLARADPLPRVLTCLGEDDMLTAALGGPGRVGMFNEAPYPRLRLLDNGGNDRDLQWLIETELQIEAYGDLDGSPGKAALRRILYLALGVLMTLPETPTPPGEPVISRVVSTRGGGWVPEPSGQPRYVAAVHVYTHAPNG
jgi:hypothetical protein